MESELKSKLESHHSNRNVFASAISGKFGMTAPPSSNPRPETLKIDNLEIVENKEINEGKMVYKVTVDVSYKFNGSSHSENGNSGVILLTNSDDGWSVSRLEFRDFLGFRILN